MTGGRNAFCWKNTVHEYWILNFSRNTRRKVLNFLSPGWDEFSELTSMIASGIIFIAYGLPNAILQAWVRVFHDAWSEILGDWMHFSAISMLGLEEEPKEELLVKGLKPGWSWCGPAVAWWECGGNDTVGMEMGSKPDGPGKRSCGPGSLVKYWDTWPKLRSKNDAEFRKDEWNSCYFGTQY